MAKWLSDLSLAVTKLKNMTYVPVAIIFISFTDHEHFQYDSCGDDLR